jgi:hypothetical protein
MPQPLHELLSLQGPRGGTDYGGVELPVHGDGQPEANDLSLAGSLAGVGRRFVVTVFQETPTLFLISSVPRHPKPR